VAVDKANKPVAATEPAPTEKFDLRIYLKDVRTELEKVLWPSREQVISESAAVFLVVLVAATFIYLIDSLFHTLAALVF